MRNSVFIKFAVWRGWIKLLAILLALSLSGLLLTSFTDFNVLIPGVTRQTWWKARNLEMFMEWISMSDRLCIQAICDLPTDFCLYFWLRARYRVNVRWPSTFGSSPNSYTTALEGISETRMSWVVCAWRNQPLDVLSSLIVIRVWHVQRKLFKPIRRKPWSDSYSLLLSLRQYGHWV